jgi:RimJ/RimL family protein N-acetyltransferase
MGQDRVVQLPAVPDLPIRTERLVLRPFDAADLEPLLVIHSDPTAVRFVPYPPRDRAAVAAVLKRKVANTALRQEGDLIPGPGGR